MVAAFRAVETAQPQPVIRDKFARLLESARPGMTAMFHHMRGYHATRIHVIDTFVTDALAAGLDSRAYRPAWPAVPTALRRGSSS